LSDRIVWGTRSHKTKITKTWLPTPKTRLAARQISQFLGITHEHANHSSPSITQSALAKGGWEVFEAEGVCPVYCDEPARDSALSYARQRAGYGRAEIQVLDENWNVVETITNEDLKPMV
jgi:hypothetical protein